MTLTINIPDEQTLVLEARANAEGVSPGECARRVLERGLVPDWLGESWERTKDIGVSLLSMEEIDSEIAAARRGRRAARLHSDS